MMINLKLLTFLVEISLCLAIGTNDNLGKEFLIGFMDNTVLSGSGNDMKVYISTLSNSDATVRVYAPHSSETFNSGSFMLRRGENREVTVPTSLRQSGNGVTGSGAIMVTSDQPISVVGYNREDNSVDGFLGLPSNSLGTEYLITTPDEESEFLIVAGANASTVSVSVRADSAFSLTYGGNTYNQHKPIPVSLQPYQTFHVYYTGRVIGSIIISNQPVAVFAGGKKPKVSASGSNTGSGHVVEQLTSTSKWGKTFIVTSTPTRPGDVIRIMAEADNTNVSKNGVSQGNIARGTWRDIFTNSNEKIYITADKPIQVSQFGKTYATGSDSSDGGDPYMSLVPPIEQWANQYVFTTLKQAFDPSNPSNSFKIFLSVVVSSGSESGMRMDGNAINSSFWSSAFTLGSKQYKLAEVVIPDGAHSIYHTSSNVVFQAMLYGLAPSQGMGYPAGMRLLDIKTCTVTSQTNGDVKDNDCDGRIDEEIANGQDDDGDGRTDEDIAGPARVDGNWSGYGPYGACSVSCNSGTETRTRNCTSPAPSNGGSACPGSDQDTRTCTKPTCPECKNDADCSSKVNTFCDKSSGANFSNHKCKCKTGYILSSGTCVKRKVGDSCSSNTDCDTVMSNTQCNSTQCVCKLGFLPKSDNSGCNQRKITNSCSTNPDCSMAVGNSNCKNNACVCNDGYEDRAVNTMCVLRKINDGCSVGVDCTEAVTNSRCDSSSCKCLLGYMVNLGLTTCTKRKVGDSCSSNTDCDTVVSNTQCTSTQCACTLGFLPNSDNSGCNRRKITNSCSTAEDCSMAVGNNSNCKNNVCVCKNGYEARTNNTTCVLRKINDGCSVGVDCTEAVTNSRCDSSSCKCLLGYMVNSGLNMCNKRKIRDACEKHEDCSQAVRSSQCANNMCTCQTTYYSSANKTSCLIRKLDDTCNSNEQCGSVANSNCKSNICKCNNGFMAIGVTECKQRVLSNPCSTNVDCSAAISDTVCSTNKCECKSGYVPDTGRCRARSVGDVCSTDQDCENAVIGSVCKETTEAGKDGKICQCGAGYGHLLMSGRKTCSAITSFKEAQCITHENCNGGNRTTAASGILYSACIQNNCTCQDGFYEHINNAACVLRQVGEKCSSHKECSGIEHTRCVGSDVQKKCTCTDRYRPDTKNSRCYEGLEDWEIVLVVIAGVVILAIITCIVCACSCSKECLKPKRKRSMKADLENTSSKEFTDMGHQNPGIDMNNPDNQY